MNCDRSKALVSVYIDGELSEELAGPLRRHLMECAECRASVSEAKAIASWFVPTAAIGVPDGFAARVARLAVSGAGAAGVEASGHTAGGADWFVPTRALREPRAGVPAQLEPRGPVSTHGPAGHGSSTQGQLRSVDRTARFAMSLAAMAAALLIGLTLLLASGDGGGFDGSAIQAQPSVENALNVLDELNRREAGGVTTTQLPAPGAPELPDTIEPPK